MFALRVLVFIMIPPELWVIWLGLRSTFAESTVRRSGNAISVRRNTLFSLIGKLIPKFVEPESINAIVELCFPGRFKILFSSSWILLKFLGFWIGFWFFFCRRDSFIRHRAFCDALAKESSKAQPMPVDKPDLHSDPDGDSQSAAVKPSLEPSPPPPPPPPPPSSPPVSSPPQSTGELITALPVPSQGKVNLLALFTLSCGRSSLWNNKINTKTLLLVVCFCLLLFFFSI